MKRALIVLAAVALLFAPVMPMLHPFGAPIFTYAQDNPSIGGTVSGAAMLNVREGPGSAYRVLGTLRRGGRVAFTGRNADATWLYFLYWDQPAWAYAGYITPDADVSALSVVGDTPQVAATGGAITLADYSLYPSVPMPGQVFTATLQLSGPGRALGPFGLSGMCAGQFINTVVSHLDASAPQPVALECTAPSATGPHVIDLVFDVDKAQSDGGMASLSFFVNRGYVTQGTIRFPPYANLDLYGGAPDLAFDGQALTAIEGAAIQALPGVGLADVHFDGLQRIEGARVASEALVDGGLYAVRLSEGYRAIVRFERWSDGAPILSFWVYEGVVA
jgi:hypothetical protein